MGLYQIKNVYPAKETRIERKVNLQNGKRCIPAQYLKGDNI